MDWNHLRVFLAVARERRLNAAAHGLGQSRPTLGRHLEALEQFLGHSLFRRTSTGYVLTEEGAAILPHVEQMEAAVSAIERHLAGGEAPTADKQKRS